MPPVDQPEPIRAQLLKTCRHRLGMSVRDFQVELCFRDAKTVLRMEAGELTIHGATWVALMYLLDEHQHEDLADQIHDLVEVMRDDLDEKRTEKWNRWQEKKRQRLDRSIDMPD
jgi:glycerol kinase